MFTDRVELLKLAVILALWAAVAAAFVSVIYRRQSDLDQAKARDLKLVYDLQLDREISARREYELTVESQLRRELASELRAQAADEVAALRAELAALRTNLEILFDADLSDRPAIETEKDTPRAAGRVTASRLDVPAVDDTDTDIHSLRTEETPIIDVPAEPHPPEDWAAAMAGGAHRLSTPPPEQSHRLLPDDYQGPARQPEPPPQAPEPRWPAAEAPQAPQQQPQPAPGPPPPPTWAPPPPPMPPMEPSPTVDAPVGQHPAAPSSPWSPPGDPTHRLPGQAGGWQPAPAEGQWIPAGAPGSNWVAPPTPEDSAPSEYVGRRRAPDPGAAEPVVPAEPVPPAESVVPAPPAGPHRGRHSATAAEPSQPPAPGAESEAENDESNGQHAGGQSVDELLARFQSAPAQGGGRRRRDE